MKCIKYNNSDLKSNVTGDFRFLVFYSMPTVYAGNNGVSGILGSPSYKREKSYKHNKHKNNYEFV